MSNSIVAQTVSSDNFSPALRQAIADAAKLQPQVNGRYQAAIELLALGAVRMNQDGSIDVASRSGGQPHHLNGRSCDCKDATFNAPLVAGHRACAHQLAAWIIRKAAILAAATPAQPAPAAPSQPPVAFTLAQLIEAAGRLNHSAAYSLQPTYIGGHGYVQLLQAENDDPANDCYLICGDWREDRLFIAQWGAAHWGEPDAAAMAKAAAALNAQLPAAAAAEPAAAATMPAEASAAPTAALKPVVGYYIESSNSSVRLLVSHGNLYPKILAQFNGDDRLDQARAAAEARAASFAANIRQATPGAQVEVRHAMLPAAWRQRMGGFQVGKAWMVYA